jgi:hypothetical protein
MAPSNGSDTSGTQYGGTRLRLSVRQNLKLRVRMRDRMRTKCFETLLSTRWFVRLVICQGEARSKVHQCIHHPASLGEVPGWTTGIAFPPVPSLSVVHTYILPCCRDGVKHHGRVFVNRYQILLHQRWVSLHHQPQYKLRTSYEIQIANFSALCSKSH